MTKIARNGITIRPQKSSGLLSRTEIAAVLKYPVENITRKVKDRTFLSSKTGTQRSVKTSLF